MAKPLSVGSKVVIPAGTKVTRAGQTSKRATASKVTVKDIKTTKTGKTKVAWKSHGIIATAILS